MAAPKPNYELMVEVIKAYIWHRKGVEVKIIMARNHKEFVMLHTFHTHAISWFNSNGTVVLVQPESK